MLEDGFIGGWTIWLRLKDLNSIESFAKREIEKSKLWFYMQFFTFNLPYTKRLDRFNDECCGVYLFAEYEPYIDEDYKFDREKFMEDQKREFACL